MSLWQHIPLSVKTSVGHRGGRHAICAPARRRHSGAQISMLRSAISDATKHTRARACCRAVYLNTEFCSSHEIGSVTDEFVRSLWSSRLPPHVQAIIMSQTSDTLEAVAELADRICEVTPARVQQIASTGNNTNCDASLLKRIDEIVTARIRTEIANHVAQIDRQRGRSRDRFRPRGRSRKSLNLRGGWCGNTSPSPSRPARAKTAEGGTRGDASQLRRRHSGVRFPTRRRTPALVHAIAPYT
ncbi:hypothetical protein ACJJTC_006823 [Scirpophaga incertulas]